MIDNKSIKFNLTVHIMQEVMVRLGSIAFLTLFFGLIKIFVWVPMGPNCSNLNELLDFIFRYGMEPNRTSDFLLTYYK